MVYRFRSFELDTEKFSLTRNGDAVAVEPKTFDLLAYLVSNGKRLLSRRELLKNVWAGRVVTDGALTNLIQNARKALGDNGIEQAFIKTVHGRGYIFLAEGLEIVSFTGPAHTLTRHPGRGNKSQSTPPVIAVLPFQNMTSDPEQIFFAEGMSEDITTELSRFRDVSVIARHSAFQYTHPTADVTKIATELNADYVLEGSVRRANDRVLINAQLADAASSCHIWAERYEAPLDDVFNIQEEIIEVIASIVSGEVQHMETERAKARSTESLSAYDHLLRGLNHHKNGHLARENFTRAVEEFKKAIELDPEFARARAWKLCAEASTWTSVSIKQLEEYIELAKHVLLMDQKESETHRILGSLYLETGNYGLCGYHFGQAIQLNPNDAMVAIKFAQYYACVGRYTKALSLANRAFRLSPRHPSWYWQIIGFIYYSMGQFTEAVDALQKNWIAGDYDYALLAACHIAMNDVDKAQLVAKRTMAITPSCSAQRLCQFAPYRDKSKVDLLVNRMVEAGINP